MKRHFVFFIVFAFLFYKFIAHTYRYKYLCEQIQHVYDHKFEHHAENHKKEEKNDLDSKREEVNLRLKDVPHFQHQVDPTVEQYNHRYGLSIRAILASQQLSSTKNTSRSTRQTN